MKKLLLSATLIATGLGLAHAVTFPQLEVFSKIYDSSSTSPDPMTYWSSPYTPSSTFVKYFPTGGWSILGFNSGETFIMSCSSFSDDDKSIAANAGLVTPKIKLPEEGGMLSFTAMNWNPTYNYQNNAMKVYVSTTGNSKEDFTEAGLVKTYSLVADNRTSGPTISSYDISLGDYAGQEVYVAFVNVGVNAGALGLNNFQIVKYMADLEITTPDLYTAAGDYTIGGTVKLRTPVTCKGFKIELVIDGEVYSTYSSTRSLNASYNSYNFAFPDKVSLSLGQSLDYEVRLTPNYEGAPTVTTKQSVACATGFPKIIVEEEATGVRCGYCPLGSAWMNYFSEKYPDRFIGIALHGGGYALGVMTSPTYAYPFVNNMQITGFPYANFNRVMTTTPHYFQDISADVESLLARQSEIKVDIARTLYDGETNRVEVTFQPIPCVDLADAKYQAAVALIEDGLSGPTDSADPTAAYWSQINNYSGLSQTQLSQYGVTSANAEELSPYYEVYTKAAKTILGCVYDHVGMGIWPDWKGAGCPITGELSATNPKDFTISFDVPGPASVGNYQADFVGVQNMANTSVVVLIFKPNGNNVEIVTAAKMKYADFVKQNVGVETLSATASMSAERRGDVIAVTAEPGTVAEIYSPDGMLLARKTLMGGTETIAPLSYRGLVIVRLTNGTNSYFNKIIL